MLGSLGPRDRQPEWMDDPAIDPREHQHALVGLARLNAYGGAVSILWRPIRQFAEQQRRPLRLLDIACGSGDVPLALSRKARRANLPLQISGCDLSPTAVRTAQEAAKAQSADVRFFEHDILNTDLQDSFDIVTCSLFLHHLDESQAIRLLTEMNRLSSGLVLVSDLLRSRFNLILVNIVCQLLTRSRVVHFDGPTSVRAAFTIAEAIELTRKAGIPEATAVPRFPCRYLLSWRPS